MSKKPKKKTPRKKISRGYQCIDWDSVDDLGEVPDSVIAERFGVSTTAVLNARKRRNIPPYIRVGRPPMTRVQKNRRVAELKKLTKGWDWSMTDRELADVQRIDGARVSYARIYQIRKMLGIALSSAFKKRKPRKS